MPHRQIFNPSGACVTFCLQLTQNSLSQLMHHQKEAPVAAANATCFSVSLSVRVVRLRVFGTVFDLLSERLLCVTFAPKFGCISQFLQCSLCWSVHALQCCCSQVFAFVTVFGSSTCHLCCIAVSCRRRDSRMLHTTSIVSWIALAFVGLRKLAEFASWANPHHPSLPPHPPTHPTPHHTQTHHHHHHSTTPPTTHHPSPHPSPLLPPPSPSLLPLPCEGDLSTNCV